MRREIPLALELGDAPVLRPLEHRRDQARAEKLTRSVAPDYATAGIRTNGDRDKHHALDGRILSRPSFQAAPLIAFQTFAGVAGISTGSAPTDASALLTAFITADSAPTVPDSPTPFTPTGLVAVGTG